MSDSLDIMAIFAHPDDAELLCGGALAKGAERGHKVGVLDLTAGEMGSQGTPESDIVSGAARPWMNQIIGKGLDR